MVETIERSWWWLFTLMLYSFATALGLDCQMRTWISWAPCCTGEVVTLVFWGKRTGGCQNVCVWLCTYTRKWYHVSCRCDCWFGIALECSVLTPAGIGSPTSSNCKVHLHWLSFSWCRSFSATSEVHCKVLHNRWICLHTAFYCCLQVSLPVVSRCFRDWPLAIAGSISPLNWGLLVPTFTWSLRSVTCCPSWVSLTQQSNDQMMYTNQEWINMESEVIWHLWPKDIIHSSLSHHTYRFVYIRGTTEVKSTFGSRSSVELAWNAFHHLRPSESFRGNDEMMRLGDPFGPFGTYECNISSKKIMDQNNDMH